jgi:hypothetical protein
MDESQEQGRETAQDDDMQVFNGLVLGYGRLEPDADVSGYADRVEAALPAIKAEPQRSLLHFMAASALFMSKGPGHAEAAHRALEHIDASRAAFADPGTPADRSILGEIASLRASILLEIENPEIEESVATTLEACEAALALLSPDTADVITVAALAYNAALRVVSLEDLSTASRAETLFRMAYERYKAAGRSEEASDAAAGLANIALARFEAGALSPAEGRAAFVEAMRLAEYSIAACDGTVRGDKWARRNELIAELLRWRPNWSAEDNAREAIVYLDRALIRYESMNDLSAMAVCANRIVTFMDMLVPPWTAKTADRYILYSLLPR